MRREEAAWGGGRGGRRRSSGEVRRRATLATGPMRRSRWGGDEVGGVGDGDAGAQRRPWGAALATAAVAVAEWWLASGAAVREEMRRRASMAGGGAARSERAASGGGGDWRGRQRRASGRPSPPDPIGRDGGGGRYFCGREWGWMGLGFLVVGGGVYRRGGPTWWPGWAERPRGGGSFVYFVFFYFFIFFLVCLFNLSNCFSFNKIRKWHLN